MDKKIFILTHPLTGNYGGLLQAYASYTVLESLGMTPYIYRYTPNDLPLTLRAYLRYFKAHMKYMLGRSQNANTMWRRLSIARKFLRGIRFFNETHPAPQNNGIRYWVGSDQVWRAIFCRMMRRPEFFFLNFATSEQRSNSIAYAASMGVDEWEGTPEETEVCKKLIKEFKAVSVREHSSVALCRNVFDTQVEQMPDPTLLLQIEDYNHIINREKTWLPSAPFLASYVLDEKGDLPLQLNDCARGLQVTLQHLLPHANATLSRDRIAISVSQWLRLVRDAEFFITDSFHGCVFAIIFNKPFVCLGNAYRGSARFDSLLSTFGLQDRLITSHDVDTIVRTLTSPIDWDRVNTIRRSEQKRAFDFLKKNLE